MSAQPFLITDGSMWVPIRDGNLTALALFLRHYTARQQRKIRQFIGPGEKLPLLTKDARALFVWRKFIDDCIDARTGERQRGVNCAVFRNEGSTAAPLSSHLILAAEIEAWSRWPGERLYTYVMPEKIRSCNPGYCFKKAGWRSCGVSGSGKLVLEKLAA